MTLALQCLLSSLLYVGTVAEDRDGDGVYSAADAPLANVVVSLDGRAWARTDGSGRFLLFGEGPGFIWVRVPEGYVPRPTYAQVSGPFQDQVNLVLAPDAHTGPLRFVHASDSHVGVVGEHDLAAALAQVVDGEPSARFILMTGDITQDSRPFEFAAYARAVATVPVPVISAAGNHDTGRDGATWARHVGPMAWSFDAGGVHFVVLSGIGDGAARAAFLTADAAFTPVGMPVAAMLHYALSRPFDDALYAALRAVGARWLFTGHYHTNRTLAYDGLTEFNVQPLVFGGLDGMPAGYQTVTFEGGEMTVEHTTITEGEVVEIIHPSAHGCAGPSDLDVVVDVVLGREDLEVTASLDGGPTFPLERGSAWAWHAQAQVTPGTHSLTVWVRRPGEAPRTRTVTFCMNPAGPDVLEPATWSQLGGGADHAGRASGPVGLPRRQRWATPVGGHVRAQAALADGRLFVPVADYGTGTDGGVVALDAASGAVLWRHLAGGAVHGSPAVQDGIVVYAAVDGVVRALDAATGDLVWTLVFDRADNPAERALHNGVAIADGTVYAGGLYHFVAADLASGVVRWERRPEVPVFPRLTYPTPAVAEDLVISPLDLEAPGAVAWESLDGSQPWQAEEGARAAASPVLVDGLAILAAADTTLSAVRLADGLVAWRTRLYGAGHDFAFWLRATPAVADGRIFVPTHFGDLLALRLSDGARLWRARVDTGRVHGVHYEAEASGMSASPVVAGSVVWIGADDGVLRALDAETGTLLATRDLGAPITGLTPGTTTMYVAGWDGVVRAIACDLPIGDDALEAIAESGCDCRVTARSAGVTAAWPALLLLLGIAASLRPRRR